MRNLKSLYAIILVTVISVISLSAQETESVKNSGLTGISLPANAERVLPNYVPAEINDTLDGIITAGNGKIRRGETEVLMWGGAKFSVAKAQMAVANLTHNLKNAGWQYEIEGEENGVTIFSLVKDGTDRRALIGFFVANDEALVLSWMEILTGEIAGGQTAADEHRPQQQQTKSTSGTSGGSIVGTWGNGNVSMLSEKNLATGQISSRGGSTFKYVFNSDGTFSFIGLMSSTMYGCTTDLFNDKRGRYEISGSNITFIPSKNYWKNTNSCSPSSNKEQNYTLERETYSYRTKVDEYGAALICLAKPRKEEACYQRQ